MVWRVTQASRNGAPAHLPRENCESPWQAPTERGWTIPLSFSKSNLENVSEYSNWLSRRIKSAIRGHWSVKMQFPNSVPARITVAFARLPGEPLVEISCIVPVMRDVEKEA